MNYESSVVFRSILIGREQLTRHRIPRVKSVGVVKHHEAVLDSATGNDFGPRGHSQERNGASMERGNNNQFVHPFLEREAGVGAGIVDLVVEAHLDVGQVIRVVRVHANHVVKVVEADS